MIFTEIDLHKMHNLTKMGYNFQQVLDEIRAERLKPCDGDKIKVLKESICDHYRVTDEELTSRSRLGHIVEARRMFCYLSRILTPKSLKYIGKQINRDHATVLHQFNNITGYVHVKDSAIISDIDDITREYMKNVKLHENKLKEKQNV